MKARKIVLGTLIILSTVMVINSCVIRVGNKTNTVSTTDVNTTAASYLDAHLISQAKAKILADEYVKNNYKKINGNNTKLDTREVYYDIEALQAYLDYVKKQASSQGVNDVGIVIAFGQYPKNGDFDAKLDPEFKGQQTVFLKPVVKKNQINYNTSKGAAQEASFVDISQIEAFDFGTLTPPKN